MAALTSHQAGRDQSLQQGFKAQRAQIMIQQALAEVYQRGRMEHLVPQLPVEGEVPAGMVTESLDGLPVGDRLQILQQAHAQQQNRFEGHTAIVGTVTTLQLRTSLRRRPRIYRRQNRCVGNC